MYKYEVVPVIERMHTINKPVVIIQEDNPNLHFSTIRFELGNSPVASIATIQQRTTTNAIGKNCPIAET